MKILTIVAQSCILISGAFAKTLPKIDAHRFDSQPVEISSSGRVYRFTMQTADVPRVGNIVLIEDKSKPIMAFRVIKSEPEKKQYIAKRVRRYDQTENLALKTNYRSIEKVADRIASPKPEVETEDAELLAPPPVSAAVAAAPQTPPTAPPAPTPAPAPKQKARRAPIENKTIVPPLPQPTPEPTPEPTPWPTPEPEPTPEPTPWPTPEPEPTAEPLPPEPVAVQEIAPSATPVPEPAPVPHFEKELDQPTPETYDEHAGSAYELIENVRLDPYRTRVFLAPGVFRNASDFVTTGELNSGFGIAFGLKLKDDFFVRRATTQDALWIEFGMAFYTRVNSSNDIYYLNPLRAELRWELNLSDTWAIHTFGGIQYNWIRTTENAVLQATYNAYQGFQPTFGFGFTVHVGPQWYFRSDFGFDRVVAGLGLRW